ncbi:MAG: hypothetical protein V3R65_08630 [Acidiferrobacterales bacterium]
MKLSDTIIPRLLALLISFAVIPLSVANPDSRKDRPDMRHQDHRMGYYRHVEGHMHGARWRQTLSDQQRAKIDKLKLEYVKKKLALKAHKKVIKVELSLLATKDNPGTTEINKKIDQFIKLKNKILRNKYAHLIAVRKILTREQRVSFDLGVMKKARQGRHSRRH